MSLEIDLYCEQSGEKYHFCPVSRFSKRFSVVCRLSHAAEEERELLWVDDRGVYSDGSYTVEYHSVSYLCANDLLLGFAAIFAAAAHCDTSTSNVIFSARIPREACFFKTSPKTSTVIIAYILLRKIVDIAPVAPNGQNVTLKLSDCLTHPSRLPTASAFVAVFLASYDKCMVGNRKSEPVRPDDSEEPKPKPVKRARCEDEADGAVCFAPSDPEEPEVQVQAQEAKLTV